MSDCFRHLDTVELIIPISGFIIFSILYLQIDVSVIVVHGKSWRWPVSVVTAVKLGLRLERPGFDRLSIETNRCIYKAITHESQVDWSYAKRQEWKII